VRELWVLPLNVQSAHAASSQIYLSNVVLVRHVDMCVIPRSPATGTVRCSQLGGSFFPCFEHGVLGNYSTSLLQPGLRFAEQLLRWRGAFLDTQAGVACC
jgi:hypothetical protein